MESEEAIRRVWDAVYEVAEQLDEDPDDVFVAAWGRQRKERGLSD